MLYIDQTGLDETELELFLTSLDYVSGLKNGDLLDQVSVGGSGSVLNRYPDLDPSILEENLCLRLNNVINIDA